MYANSPDPIAPEAEWSRTSGNICTNQVSRRPQGSPSYTRIKGVLRRHLGIPDILKSNAASHGFITDGSPEKYRALANSAPPVPET